MRTKTNNLIGAKTEAGPNSRLVSVALRRYFMMRVTIVGIKKVRMYKA